jgi:hypothetical protein
MRLFLFTMLSLGLVACGKSPSDKDIREKVDEYYKTCAPAFSVSKVDVVEKGKFNDQSKTIPIKIRVFDVLAGEEKDIISKNISSLYEIKFTEDEYGKWQPKIQLVMEQPPDSIIKMLAASKFQGQIDSINIGQIATFDQAEQGYPVKVRVFGKVAGESKDVSYEAAVKQDNFGIWRAQESLSESNVALQVKQYLNRLEMPGLIGGSLRFRDYLSISQCKVVDKMKEGNRATVICDLRFLIKTVFVAGSWPELSLQTYVGKLQFPTRDSYNQQRTTIGQKHDCQMKFLFERYDKGWKLNSIMR